MKRVVIGLILLGVLVGCRQESTWSAKPQAAVDSKIDVWGEAALRQRGGPSFEFFDKLLPPLRYVDADFRVYPIVLSAPGADVKARLLSDGSQVNALARQPNWRNEAGILVSVLVGADREVFGRCAEQLHGPVLEDGFVPIVRFAYRDYAEEAFVATDSALGNLGAVFVKFDFRSSSRIELRFATGYTFLAGDGNVVRQADGKVIAAFDGNWDWNKYRSCLTSKASHATSACVVIFTQPASPRDLVGLGATFHPQPKTAASEPSTPVNEPPAGPPGELVAPTFTDGLAVSFNSDVYAKQREVCDRAWHELIARGTQIEVPEAYVNNAWRGLTVGSYEMLVGDHLNYSAGNQYARQYVAESGDAITSLMLLGQKVQPMLGPILEYRRRNMDFHNAGLKLQLLARDYWVTRDVDYVRRTRPLWQHEVQLILSARDPQTGMLPKEQYCGDIPDLVTSLVSAANCWRGLRDISAVLRDIGDSQGEELSKTAAEWRKQILTGIEQATNHSTDPPFVPVYPGEAVHDPITSTRLGSYWNLMSGYMLGSGVFRYDSPTATGMMRYLQTHGGLCMGMVRVQSARSFWAEEVPQNIDDLYGLRYALLLQERDEPDRALVGFYGKLAQGMTRDTFEDGEATSILPVELPHDLPGRYVYLPPNSAANANFLQQLRNVLVQDWDLDDDGVPDTLRLCFATPRAWMEDGKTIRVVRAPTAFGEVSFTVESHVKRGEVIAHVTMPPRVCAHAMMRFRLPPGKRIESAAIDGVAVKVIDDETIDLSGRQNEVVIHVKIR